MKECTFRLMVSHYAVTAVRGRDLVRQLFALLPMDVDHIVLDFTAVGFISRSAAHELMVQKERLEKESVTVDFTSVCPEAQAMLNAVQRTMYASSPVPNAFQVIRTKSLAELRPFLRFQ